MGDAGVAEGKRVNRSCSRIGRSAGGGVDYKERRDASLFPKAGHHLNLSKSRNWKIKISGLSHG